MDLVHDTYCQQLLRLTDLAEGGRLEAEFHALVAAFLHKVSMLTGLLHDLLRLEPATCSAG